jgi:hypothetical protein
MTHALREQVRELCDILAELSRAAEDGPCWCQHGIVDRHTMPHNGPCARARAAISRSYAIAPDDTPGYGFGV